MPIRDGKRLPLAGPSGAAVARLSLLEAEPELAAGVPAQELALARQRASAVGWLLPRGRWSCEPLMFEDRESLGLLVLDGLIARHLAVGAIEAVELVGPGDVLRPWVGLASEISDRVSEHWMVTRRSQIANLDATFSAAVAPWPSIAANINDRLARRADWLALASAVQGMRRTEDRLLAILWIYADRWGRMTPDGVVLELELTHSLLGAVIGARRPSVTTSLKALEAAGVVMRRRDRSWLLRHQRPATLSGPGDPEQEEAYAAVSDEMSMNGSTPSFPAAD
ncbi:MAG: helix-turn-helix domain-containing protein [Solirubrobacteraceae bacterium]